MVLQAGVEWRGQFDGESGQLAQGLVLREGDSGHLLQKEGVMTSHGLRSMRRERGAEGELKWKAE